MGGGGLNVLVNSDGLSESCLQFILMICSQTNILQTEVYSEFIQEEYRVHTAPLFLSSLHFLILIQLNQTRLFRNQALEIKL